MRDRERERDEGCSGEKKRDPRELNQKPWATFHRCQWVYFAVCGNVQLCQTITRIKARDIAGLALTIPRKACFVFLLTSPASLLAFTITLSFNHLARK